MGLFAGLANAVAALGVAIFHLALHLALGTLVLHFLLL